MFALVLLSNMDSLDYNWSRNYQGENSFYTEKWKNLQFLSIAYLFYYKCF